MISRDWRNVLGHMMKLSENEIPACLGPRPVARTPEWKAPSGSWDMQFHVLGPPARYPYAPTRHYTPPPAALENYMELAGVLGIGHAVVVHANTQGPDNDIYLEAIARCPEMLIGVIQCASHFSLEQARNMQRAGVRGVRFAFNPQHGGIFDAAAIQSAALIIREMNWYLQLHMSAEDLVRLEPFIASLPCRVVIDHFGRIDTGFGMDQPAFQTLLRLARHSQVWVKLSGADRISRLEDWCDVDVYAHALADVAIDRLVWGSDWPHTGYFRASDMPDDIALFNALGRWFVDSSSRRAILVDNPRRLAGLS